MKPQSIDFKNVTLLDGFWRTRQSDNAAITIYSIYEKFKETGRFEAAKLGWRKGEANEPHIFWDSDIAKWIEAASYIIQKNNDPTLISRCDELIDIIVSKQEDSGYYNIYFQTCEPHARFTRRTDHELYCAGHLMEAAVAYYEATNKDKFLKAMCRYADYIERIFVTDKSSSFQTPGHEEIELALLKLYRCTNEPRYLALAKHFIDARGISDTDFYETVTAHYAQDHLPVREQTTAEGHAVRACYLYTAMADLANECKDDSLMDACKAIFQNIIEKRMYITGGIGSTYYGEAFTIDYDLPNETAYAESCAAIALIFFAQRMLDAQTDAVYADTIERVLYNGFLSSISLDAKAFFYKNPLAIVPEFAHRYPSSKDQGCFPETKRLEVFSCSCCPPNISRLLATLGGYIFAKNDDTLLIHQYISSKTDDIEMISGFPNDGAVTVRVNGPKTVGLRIPGWCTRYTVRQNGCDANGIVQNGYLYLSCSGETTIDICFDMPVVFMESNPNVTQNAGKICCTRGPLVYCAEQIDNTAPLRTVYVSEESAHTAVLTKNESFSAYTITVDAFKKEAADTLYAPASSRFHKTTLTLIPYYGFANRQACEMMVWLNRK